MTSFSNLTMRVIGGSFVFRVKRGVQFRMRKCKKTSVNYCGILRSVLQDLYLANRQAQNPARFHLGRKSARSLIFLTELIFPPEAVLACLGDLPLIMPSPFGMHSKTTWNYSGKWMHFYQTRMLSPLRQAKGTAKITPHPTLILALNGTAVSWWKAGSSGKRLDFVFALKKDGSIVDVVTKL